MATPRSIQRTYVILMLGNTLAASFIWGINTLFLLDAGLSNLEAFAANAFFTAGMVVFEVPTGIVADTIGRRASYLLGTVTLTGSTLLYVLLWQVGAPFWQWAIASMSVGLGFTFFSGAVEAWLVDALNATGFTGDLESVFGRGQIATGAGMLTGSVAFRRRQVAEDLIEGSERSPSAGGAGKLEQLVAQGDGFRQVHAHRTPGVRLQSLDSDCLGSDSRIRGRFSGRLRRCHSDTVAKRRNCSSNSLQEGGRPIQLSYRVGDSS